MNKEHIAYEFGDFCLDGTEKQLRRKDGEIVLLPPKTFDLLLFLARNSNRLLSKDELMEGVWNDSFVEEGNLKLHIHTLRKALSDGGVSFIETVQRRGYRFNADVRPVSSSSFVVEKIAESRLVIEETVDDPPAIAGRRRRYWPVAATLAGLMIAAFASVGLYRNAGIAPTSSKRKSIAVLPLKSLTPDQQSSHLSIGFTDALITKLGSLKGLVVRPTSAVAGFSGDSPTPETVGRQLNVESYVEGTIQKEGGRIRVSLQLVDVSDGAIVWTGKFEESENGLLALQDLISTQLATAANASVSPAESVLLAKRDTDNAEAFESYLKGRFYWNRRTAEDIKKAIEHFNDARAKDPNYAMAYVGLSDSYQVLSEYSTADRKQSAEMAREAITKALSIDDRRGEAHCSHAYLQAFYDWDFDAAEKSFRRALELSPNYATAHQWYGEFLLVSGKPVESLEQLRIAQELDPLSMIIATDIAAYYYVSKQFDSAIAQCRSVLERDPKFAFAHVILALSHLQKGETKEFAEVSLTADSAFFPPEAVEMRRSAYRDGGIDALFRMRYEMAVNPPLSAYHSDYYRAMASADLRNGEKAFEWLEKSRIVRDRWFVNVNNDPQWDFIRSDPRFADLLKRAGFVR